MSSQSFLRQPAAIHCRIAFRDLIASRNVLFRNCLRIFTFSLPFEKYNAENYNAIYFLQCLRNPRPTYLISILSLEGYPFLIYGEPFLFILFRKRVPCEDMHNDLTGS